jgi:predicted ribosome quality control (RQC) complex YloA/Tae2 family protein
MQNFRTIKSAYRVDNNIIKITFDKNNEYFFDISKQNSSIFKKDNFHKTKDFTAPFDTILNKKFSDSKIESIKVLEQNRVIQINVQSKSSYKLEQNILQLEFTGKKTNAIILTPEQIVVEALRHIDHSVSYREIKPNKKLLPLLEYKINEDYKQIEDIEEFLYQNYEKISNSILKNTKVQIINNYQKKVNNITKKINSLANEEELIEESNNLFAQANCVLANIGKINLYQKKQKLKDYEGNEIVINIPQNMKSDSHLSNNIFQKAKKQKQKAQNQYIQKENLLDKKNFYVNLIERIKNINSLDEIKIYSNKTKNQSKTKDKSQDNYESFFFEGHKIMVGRTQKENIYLLKNSSKNDYWFHIKDITSSHVIVKTNKSKISDSVCQFAAKLCVDTSVKNSGSYLIDYTKRSNVKPQDGSNVLYVNYKTIKVEK